MAAKRKTTPMMPFDISSADSAPAAEPAHQPAPQPQRPHMLTPFTPATPSMEKTMKTTEDFLAFGQSNLDAFVKSSQIWAAGVQDISKQVAATAQASFDENMASFKVLAAVKTPKEALDMQATLARTSLEKAVAETGKITDASMKLAEQVFAPLTAQMTAVAEKFAKVA